MTDAERELIAKEKTAAEEHYCKLKLVPFSKSKPIIDAHEALIAFHAGAAWAREQQERVVHESLPLDKLNQVIEMIQRQNVRDDERHTSQGERFQWVEDWCDETATVLMKIDDRLTGKDAPQSPTLADAIAYKMQATDESGQSAGFGATDTSGPTRSGITQEIYENYMLELHGDAADLAKYRREVPALDAEIARLKAEYAGYQGRADAMISKLSMQNVTLRSSLDGQTSETLRLQKQIDNAKAMWS